MFLIKKSLIIIEGDLAQMVERRTSHTGPMVQTLSEAILRRDSLESIGQKVFVFIVLFLVRDDLSSHAVRSTSR